MAQITYTDKVALNVNSDIPDINKVNASDMNEIKQVVNENETTMNRMIVNTQSNSQTNTYSCNYINGTVLYENQSGTTGNITLSDSVNNYRYIEIYYGTIGSGINCVKIIPSITNNCNFTSFNITGGTTYIYSTQTTISGTSITITAYARGPISAIAYDANFNSIFKVIGYK